MKKISIMLAFLSAICVGRMSSSISKSEMKDALRNPNITMSVAKENVERDKIERKRMSQVTGHSELWEPVTEIEDGSVYMIRSAQNPDLVWDLTNGSLNNGTKVQLYNINYTQAQKFYVKKQFDVNGYETYRFSPLYNYDKVLRVTSKSQNANVQLADETYTDLHLFSDKFAILKIHSSIPTQFAITSCVNQDTGMKISVNSLASGQKLVNKTHSYYVSNMITTWEFIKTDYVGLHVKNKTWVEGTSDFRYVARVPFTGRYVIETSAYYSSQVDTVLVLKRDSDGVVVATNDDGGEGYFSKIVYNFQTTEEFSIFVRGYNDDCRGSCYLLLRPEKTIYLSGTYDIDNHHHDRTKALNESKPYLRSMGYFPEVETNFNHDSIFNEYDWEGGLKMDRDYYFFRGHGGNDGTCAVYFDGANPDWVHNSQIPTLTRAGLVAWIICSGANEPTSGTDHCMARATAMMGAQHSLGFRKNIGTNAADTFTKKFIQNLASYSLEESIKRAVQSTNPGGSDGLWQPSLFLNGGHTEYRYTITRTTFSKQIVSW